METYLLDANVVLRRDELAMAAAANALFARAERGGVRLMLDSLILAEVVFVLQSLYEQGGGLRQNAFTKLDQTCGVNILSISRLSAMKY